MTAERQPPNYKRHRFPPEIIGHAVWLYFRFTLSFRDVEELLAERGPIASHFRPRRTASPPKSTDNDETNTSPPGAPSRASPLPPEPRVDPRQARPHAAWSPHCRLKLTMPARAA